MGEYFDSVYTVADGVILFYEDNDISLNVPERMGDMEIRAIGDGAFMESQALEFVSVPAGIRTIGQKAFKGCLNLKSVAISGSFESIGNKAFTQCKNLKKIRINNYEVSEKRYQELKASARCANGTVYIASTFLEDKKLRDVVNATSAPAANLVQDTIPRLIVLEEANPKGFCNFMDNNCYAFDGKSSQITEKQSVRELMRDDGFRTVDVFSEAKNDLFMKNENVPNIQKTSIFTFNDGKTRHENGKCYLFAEIVIGFFFWQSVVKIIVEGRPYHMYRRHFLASGTDVNYIRKDVAIFNDKGCDVSGGEAKVAYAKYKLLSIL